jgi:cation transporter-like permease
MSNDQVSEKSVGSKRMSMTWIVVAVIVALIVWFVYSASQTFVLKPDNRAMPSMNMSAQATSTMPANMPGMDH